MNENSYYGEAIGEKIQEPHCKRELPLTSADGIHSQNLKRYITAPVHEYAQYLQYDWNTATRTAHNHIMQFTERVVRSSEVMTTSSNVNLAFWDGQRTRAHPCR